MSPKAPSSSNVIVRYCAIGPAVGAIAALMVLAPLDGDLIAEIGVWRWMRGLPVALVLALFFGYLIGLIPASLTGACMAWLVRGRSRPAFWPVWGGLIGACFTALPYLVFPQLRIDGAGMLAYPALVFIGFLAGSVPAMSLSQGRKGKVGNVLYTP